MKTPLYSVCIANYNMNRTLKQSLTSVLNQLNENFEVIVVDDGSDDLSVQTLLEIKKNYSNLTIIPLLRDKRRKLGETRNVSIRAARGKYVLLHLDADDIWDNFIVSFTRLYHEIEKRMGLEDFMLSGAQINMATRNLLINNPYPNVYYGEDRLLWSKLAVLNKLICIKHTVFRKRIAQKSFKRKLIKIISSQFSAMTVTFSYSPDVHTSFIEYIKRIIFRSDWGIKLSIVNIILLIPAFINGYFLNRPTFNNFYTYDYRELNTLNLKELEEKTIDQYGDFNLDKNSRLIFMR